MATRTGPTKGVAFPVAVLTLSAALLLLLTACGSQPTFHGTPLDPPMEAPNFQLTDQFGQRTSLADFRGKVVALTFLYTSCPDVCPLTTKALRKAHEALGGNASGVTFVAITVDPARDTPQRAYEYSQGKGMIEVWRFLTGSVEELRPVWDGYFIAADPYRQGEGGATTRLSQATLAQASDGVSAPYLIAHQAPVYLVDKEGRIRVLHSDVTLDSGPLVQDIQTLLRD
ncbi:MAG: SCO family protein [Chloroflexi bacterium]|nr:SCO family protein [Chloroflexota bacterium]